MLFNAFAFMMKLAPFGAFGAMAFTVGRYGIKSIGSLGLLITTFYIACLFFVFVVLGVLARLHGFSLWKLLRYIREELLIVLATSSSEPVLPRLLVKLEKLGCKNGIVGLVLPAGYSFNLDGTAIYLTPRLDLHRPGDEHPAHLGSGAGPAGRDAADLEGCGRRDRQRLRGAGGHPDGDPRHPGRRCGHHRRHRPLHVRGARAHQHLQQCRGLRAGRDVGKVV